MPPDIASGLHGDLVAGILVNNHVFDRIATKIERFVHHFFDRDIFRTPGIVIRCDHHLRLSIFDPVGQ